MKRKSTFLIVLLLLCQLSMAQRKTFTGDVSIFNYDDFEAFINEKYTHIEGNLTIIQSINNVSNHGHILDDFPNGLNSLVEISGTFKLQLDANESTLDPKNLIKVGGDLDIRNVRKIKLRKLKEVGGDFLPQDILFLEELSVPRLEFIGGDLDWFSAPEKIRFPRLRTISGDMILEGDTKTTLIYMPRLTQVLGNIDIDGVTIPSNLTLQKLNLQQLRTVGGTIKLELPYSEIETPVLNNLKTVGGDFTVIGTIPEMPKLEEVLGKFHVRSSGVNSNIDLSFPSLVTVTGDLEFEGLNNNPNALRSFSAAKLEQVGGNITHNTFLTQGAPIKEFNAPSLKLANVIGITTNAFDLSGLEQITSLNIREISANAKVEFNALKSGQFSLVTEDGKPLASIDAPVLESSTGIAVNALDLYYPNLRSGITSLGFDNDITSGIFSSIEKLDDLSFEDGDITDMDFSSLESVGDFSVRNLTTFSASFPKLEEINELTIYDATLNGFHFDAPRINQVYVEASSLHSAIFRGLENVQVFSLATSDVTGELNLAAVKFANSVYIQFNTPAGVDLQNLASTAVFDDNQKGLRFINVSELDLGSLIQIEELSLGKPNSPESSVLKSVSLSSLKRINSLEIGSDVLESLTLGQLQTVRTFTLNSEEIGSLALNSLNTAQTLNIEVKNMTNIDLAALNKVENLTLQNTDLFSLDLGSLTNASSITLKNHPHLDEIDLENLPELRTLTLEDLPKLDTITTTKPNEEGGLLADYTVENIKEETIEETCDDGALLSRTFYPALRSITLTCEAYETADGTTSRAVVDEDIQYVMDRQGTGYTFTEEISFPTISVSLEELNFGTVAEEETSTSLELNIANNGQADAALSLSFLNNDKGAYSVDASSFTLEPGGSKIVTVTFTPGGLGQDKAFLEINSVNNSENLVALTGIKDGCIQIGEMCFKALNVIAEGDGKFRLSNQVVLADFLKFSGEVEVDTNAGSIEGNGQVYIEGIPSLGNLSLAGKVELYQGEFEFNLIEGAQQKLASKLEDGTNNLLRFANLPIQMADLEFIENGIQFSARMNLPSILNGTQVDIETVQVTTTDGVVLVGEITAPGEIKLAKAAVLKDLFFTFDTGQNEFGGGATVETKLFDISARVLIKKGALDEVGVTIVPAKPIPVGTTGWSLTEGKGELISLQSPPPTLSLSVDMEPSVVAGFDLVKLNDLGLSYTFGRSLAGSGELQVLDQTVARAKLLTTGNSIQFEGEVNFGDYIIGKAFMSADNTSNGMRLRGAMNAKVQIPNRDSFFHQVFDGAIGLPYTVASAETRFYNTVFTGETNILGFGIAYGLAYIDSEFQFDLAKSHDLLNQEVFGNVGGGTANFDNSLRDRFEGRSLKFKPRHASETNSAQAVDGTEQTEQTFSISRDLEDIYIRVQHETVMPEYSVTFPDGTEINAENALDKGVLFAESETETKQAFFAFKNPAQGEWKIEISSEDVEYNIDVAGADPAPSISFKTFEKDGETITVPWTLNNVNEDYKVHLLFDNDKEHFDGNEIASNLAFDSESQEWNITGLPTGEYYVYAELENTETGVTKAFYTNEPLNVVEAGAPDAPTGMMVTNNDIEVLASWGAVEGAAEYSVYYEIDKAPDFNSESFQTDGNSLLMTELTPGKNYFIAVSAWNADDVQGQLSEAVSLEFTSTSLNNAPILEQVADQTIIATVAFSQELSATDQEEDELSFSLAASPDGMTLTEQTINWTPTEAQLGAHIISVEVTDDFGNLDAMEFTLQVERPSAPPTDITLSAASIEENNQVNQAIGTLSAVDEDTNDLHSFELVSGEGDSGNASFKIEGNQLQAAASFNFEEQSNYSVRVKTTDKVGQAFEKTFEITVTNANEAPTEMILSSQSVAENQTAGTEVGTLSIADPDESDTHSYAFTEGAGDTDNASFSIDGNRILTIAPLDFETKAAYEIRIAGTDAGGLSLEKQFMITVEDGPDPQISASVNALTFEATALGLSNEMTFEVQNPGAAELLVTGMNVPIGFTVSSQSFTVSAGGAQEVTVTFSPTAEQVYEGNLTIESNAGTVTVTLSGEGAIITSIDEPTLKKNQLTLYPNPSSEVLNLSVSGLGGQPYNLGFYDRTGNAVLRKEDLRETEQQIRLSNWAPGIYLVRIATEKGSIVKPIIVKK